MNGGLTHKGKLADVVEASTSTEDLQHPQYLGGYGQTSTEHREGHFRFLYVNCSKYCLPVIPFPALVM